MSHATASGEGTTVSTADGGPADNGRPGRRPGVGASKVSVMRARPWVAFSFLLPALLLLGALVVYPIVYSLYRSFFDASGSGFVGLGNYVEVFTDDRIFTAVKNNLIWVLVAPAVATALGLIFAVLTERIRWGTAFKLVIFMPMAISMLAAGIIFRLVYQADPDRGVANAVVTTVHDTFTESSKWPGARPRPDAGMTETKGGSFTTSSPAASGDPADLPLVGVPPVDVADAAPAKPAHIHT
jgi:alpha-glucoside transport system permease protein